MNLYEWPTPNPAPKPTRHWGLDKSDKIIRVRSYEFIRISHLVKYVRIAVRLRWKYSKLPWDKNLGVCLVMSSKDSSCYSALFSQSWIITCTKLHLLLPLSSTSTHQSHLISFSTKPWEPQYNWERVRFINILEQGRLSPGPRVLFSCCS